MQVLRAPSFFVLLSLASASLLGAAYTPSYGYHFLVAGNSEPGFADGNFIDSSFRGPEGLALAPDGAHLYVADTGNHRLRAIDLIHQNRVSSLGAAGKLSAPTEVVMGKDPRALYVLDRGNTRLQKMALPGGALSAVYEGPALAGLAMEPQGRWPLLIDGQKKAILELGPQIRVLAQSEVLAKPGLRLACLDPGIQVFDPGSGSSYAIKEGALQALVAKVPGGQGFVAGLDTEDQPRLIVWEGQAGLFKLLDSAGAAEDFPLYDSRGALISVLAGPKPGLFARAKAWVFGKVHAARQAWRVKEAAMTRDPKQAAFLEHFSWLGSLWNRTAIALGDNKGHDLESLRSDRHLFVGTVGLAFDPVQHLIYAAEKSSNRILALKLAPLSSRNRDGLMDLGYPAAKAPGITRILIVGDSFTFMVGGTKGPLNASTPKQFEAYLNALNAIHGTGRRYEVLTYMLGGGLYQGSPLSKLLGLQSLLTTYKIDEVICHLSHSTMVLEGLAWTRGPTVDDVSSGQLDPSFFVRVDEEDEKKLGPLSREFLAFLRGHRQLWQNWQGDWPYVDGLEAAHLVPLRHPQIKAMILKKLDKVLGLDQAFLAPQKIKFAVSYEPFKIFIGSGESEGGGYEGGAQTGSAVLNAPFAALAARRGIPFYDILKMTRLIDPAVFPLFSYGDQHMLAQGHQWVAWMLAQEYYYGDR